MSDAPDDTPDAPAQKQLQQAGRISESGATASSDRAPPTVDASSETDAPDLTDERSATADDPSEQDTDDSDSGGTTDDDPAPDTPASDEAGDTTEEPDISIGDVVRYVPADAESADEAVGGIVDDRTRVDVADAPDRVEVKTENGITNTSADRCKPLGEPFRSAVVEQVTDSSDTN